MRTFALRSPTTVPARRRAPARAALTTVLWFTVLLFGAIFVGAGVAMGELYFAAAIAALALGIPMLLLPMELVLWLALLAAFLISGQLQYYAGISKAFWIPYLFGALLWARLPLDMIAMRQRVPNGPNTIKYWAFLFLATVAFGVIANAPPLLQVLLALKEYLFIWSVLVVLSAGFLPDRFYKHIWVAVLWLVPLHIPAILYQRFIVAANRSGNASFDSVVGLFGGDPEHAGAVGAMGLFLLFALLLAISLWRAGKLRLVTTLLISATVVACVLLAEVKLVILLLPLSIALLYGADLLRRPLRSIGMLCAAVLLAIGISMAYQSQFANRYNSHAGPFGYIESAIEKNSDSQFRNPQTGEIGRIASLTYWWKEHSMDDPVHFLMGHGMGSARYGRVMGEEARKNAYYRIDRSTAATYLWETGLLGLVAFTCFLLAAALLATRTARNLHLDAGERAVLSAIAAILWLQPVVLLYNNDLSGVPQSQLMLMLMAGQVIHSARRAAQGASSQRLNRSPRILNQPRSSAPSAPA